MHNRPHHAARNRPLITLILIFAFVLSACQPKAAAPASLPPYPPANFEWSFNDRDLTLLDPQGAALYALTADSSGWQPVVSPGLQGLLPPGIQVAHDLAGDWVIVDAAGKTYQVWDAAAFTWKSVAALTETQQAAEQALAEFTQTAAAQATPTERIRRTETPQPTEVDQTMSPPVATVPPAQQACLAALPSRLTAGGTARVTLSLNLRSSAEIGNNFVRSYLPGEILNLIAGPNCIPYENSAYIWWQVSGPDGSSGWVVEATLSGSGYFLDPVP